MPLSSSALNPAFYPDKLIFAPIPFYPAVPDPISKALIHADMYNPLFDLYRASVREGLELYGISAYRSYYRQLSIYNESIVANGYEHTQKYIAFPGTSEHQTGFAIDFSCPKVNFELDESFAGTREGIWLEKHAADFGFVLSYPKKNSTDKMRICHDSIAYEPWHICYRKVAD